MLSGELHSIEDMTFTFEYTADGYQARMKHSGEPGGERIVKWGINDIVQEDVSSKFKPSDKSILYLLMTGATDR